jgi:lysophosphatidylcholine acyltransferase/lyso-PAF acetyltransferase
MRVLFLFGGFHWVTVRGKQASAKDAPVLVVSPHSTYFDALPVVLMGGPGVVAKGETGRLPLFGSTSTHVSLSAARNECAERCMLGDFRF